MIPIDITEEWSLGKENSHENIMKKKMGQQTNDLKHFRNVASLKFRVGNDLHSRKFGY